MSCHRRRDPIPATGQNGCAFPRAASDPHDHRADHKVTLGIAWQVAGPASHPGLASSPAHQLESAPRRKWSSPPCPCPPCPCPPRPPPEGGRAEPGLLLDADGCSRSYRAVPGARCRASEQELKQNKTTTKLESLYLAPTNFCGVNTALRSTVVRRCSNRWPVASHIHSSGLH